MRSASLTSGVRSRQIRGSLIPELSDGPWPVMMLRKKMTVRQVRPSSVRLRYRGGTGARIRPMSPRPDPKPPPCRLRGDDDGNGRPLLSDFWLNGLGMTSDEMAAVNVDDVDDAAVARRWRWGFESKLVVVVVVYSM